MKFNESTNVAMPIRNLISIIAAVAVWVSGAFFDGPGETQYA